MGSLGTFDSFTTARLGIYAAQIGLQVTGNNISNINTAGYTRQRTDQMSFKSGVNDRYASMMDNHVGKGALVRDINQIRDPYLDIRYRCTSTETSYYDTKLSGLQELAAILDEVGKGIKDGDDAAKGDGILYANLQDLATKLRSFSADPTVDNDTLVRQSATTLCSMFNLYADKLEKLRHDTEEDFNISINAVNKILANIRDLNKSIRTSEINGDNALEMRDERNRQIDELAKYTSIKVQYSMEDVGAGILVEKLTILMGDSNPDPTVTSDSSMLVDGLYCTQLSVPEQKPQLNPYYGITKGTTTGDLLLSPAYPPTYDYDKFEYLKDYLYTKKVSEDSAEVKTLVATGIGPVWARDENGDPIIENGKNLYLVGTNDPAAEGILTEPNKNFTVQLGKLLDTHDEEWKSTDTTWDTVTGIPGGAAAKYQYTISLGSDKFAANDKISISGNDYTVGTDITENDANDAVELAKFIVQNLTPDNDYNITADGSNIIFTAKNIGLVGITGTGPNAEPPLTLMDGGDKLSLSARKTVTVGADNDPNADAIATTTDPFTGNDKTVNYVQVGESWSKVTIITKKARDIVLDDNDLHGELQAQRELLTEEGEFASAKDIQIDENAAIKRGIPYYQKAFDLLAQKFAEAYNGLNYGTAVDQNGDPLPETVEVTVPAWIKVRDPATGLYEVWQRTDRTKPYFDDPNFTFNNLSFESPDPNADMTAYNVVKKSDLINKGYTQKAGWTVDTEGYCVDTVGGTQYYTGVHGSHGTGCIIFEKIPVAEYTNGKMTNSEAVLAGLKQTGYDYTACMAIDAETDPDEKIRLTQELLVRCLNAHGVNVGTGDEDEVYVVTRDVEMGGPLFSNRNDGNDTTGITASNISVSFGWSHGTVNLVPKFEVLFDGDVVHSTQNTNADRMVTMIDKALAYNPADLFGVDADDVAIGPLLFEGSFNDMFSNLMGVQAKDASMTNVRLTTSYTSQVELDSAREGVSGVDLNDEAMNMIQYQKAMSAAMRLMTTIDEALDRLINNTGVVGR